MNQDKTKQAQLGEALRARFMVAELLEKMDERLVELGYREPESDHQRLDALDQAADLIAARPPEAWDGWVTYLLKALDKRATTDDFHRVLEALQADIASRLVEGQW